MGLAALVVVAVIALAIAVSIVYGTFVGLARLGQFLWRLLVAPEGGRNAEVATARASPICWEEKQCPPPVREACPAYVQRAETLSCWLTNLRAEGGLRPACFSCSLFSIRDLVA